MELVPTQTTGNWLWILPWHCSEKQTKAKDFFCYFFPHISIEYLIKACRVYFSTKSMRNDGGFEVIKRAIGKLQLKHKEHIAAYGEGNERRLTGRHETADINTFSWVRIFLRQHSSFKNSSTQSLCYLRWIGCGESWSFS